MINSVLILSPHQDDDLNIAGCLLDQLNAANISISVCFVTNGDYRGVQEQRAKEVHKVSALFGYKSIFYLGYGDGGYNNALANAPDDDTVTTSPAGYSETHGVLDFNDFHFLLHGKHAEYTKANMRTDIRELLLFVHADLIFCVDKDEHPDHKLVSNLFDDALNDIIRTTDYRPLVLKKFAYLGTWFGPEDYFIRPAKSTVCFSKGLKGTVTSSTPYEWSERIRFAVTPEMYRLCFWKSLIFKAYRFYSSQNGIKHFLRAVNSDAVYWFIDTKNECKISKDFPIENTPFHLFNEPDQHNNHFCYLFNLLYKLYVTFIYRVENKIKRIIKHNFGTY